MNILSVGKGYARCVILILATCALSAAQGRENSIPANVSLTHFAQIDKQVYVGSKPRTDRDFQFLQSKHIRYIVSARFWPFFSGAEKSRAKRYGMTLISLPLNASPIPPSEKHFDDIMLALRDKQHQPVYVHCVLGRDRTSLISGLYKRYFLGVPKSEVWEEMRQSGFRTSWFVHGLEIYFDKHSTSIPPALEARSAVPSW